MFPATGGSTVCALCTFCMGCRCRFSTGSTQCQKCTIFSCDECWKKCQDTCPVCVMLTNGDPSPIRVADPPSTASAASSSSSSSSSKPKSKICACQECPGTGAGKTWSCHTCRQIWHTACKPDTKGHANQCLACYGEQMYAEEMRKKGKSTPTQLTREFSSRAVHTGSKIVSDLPQPTPAQSFAGFAVDLAAAIHVPDPELAAGSATFGFKNLDYTVHDKSSEERDNMKTVLQRRNPNFRWAAEPVDLFGVLARLSQEAVDVPALTGGDLVCFEIANWQMERGNLGPLAVCEVRRAFCCLLRYCLWCSWSLALML